ncbi:MAG TPA: hypothetical protein DCM08_01215 [Microscillaceae bacterium]|nr:hypothetical protein [Microscillaceae bacterium]
MLLAQVAFAQYFAEELFHNGSAILKTEEGKDEKVTGEIKYNLGENTLMLRSPTTGLVKTLGSRKVLSFQFMDQNFNKTRVFYTLPYQIQYENREVPTFFELLVEGKYVSLLCREKLVTTTVSPVGMYSPMMMGGFMAMPITQTRVGADYFLLFITQKGNDVSIRIKPVDKKEEVLESLKDRRLSIERYMEENKLRFFDRDDMVAIISQYNVLKNKQDDE